MNPLISVIMPAYCCADTIRSAVESVLRQKVPLELIVLDNASPDDLEKVLAVYLSDERVRYIRLDQNLGAAGGRNKGISLAKAPYVAFLDSDDFWADGKLQAQMELLEKTNAVLCCTGRELITPQGEPTGRYIGVPEEISYRKLLRGNLINCSSVLLKTSVAKEFPMEHEDSHEDYIMWLKILKKYGKAVGINQPMLKYRLTDTGKSGSKLKSARMTYKVYRYSGFGNLFASLYFLAYVWNGIIKYAKAFLKTGRIKR